MAGVQVTFGANIQDVVDAVDKLKGMFEHLAETIGVALTVRGVGEFVSQMGELGLQAESVGLALGVSNKSVVDLTGYAKLGGQSVQELASEIEKMSLQAQRSTRDGLNPQAQAFAILGINVKALIGQPADQWFLSFADAVSKFNPSLNLTNAVMQAGGRGVAAMLPTLLQGKEHVQEFLAAWRQASEGLAAAVPGMADTHEKLLLLDQSASSFGARIFTALKPAIDAVIGSVTRWLQSMDVATVARFADAAVGYIERLAVSTISFFAESKQTTDDFLKSLQDLWAYIAAPPTVTIEEGTLASWIRDNIVKPIQQWNSEAHTLEEAGAQYAARVNEAFNSIQGNAASGGKTVAQTVHDVLENVRKEIAAGMAGLGDTKSGNVGGLNAGAINEGAQQALAIVQRTYQGMVRAADDAYKQTADRLGFQLKTHEITQDEETRQLLAALEVRNQAEQAAFDAELDRLPKGTAQYIAALNERKAAYDKYILDRQKVTEKAAEDEAKRWQSVADQIAGAFNSQLKGLLAGTTSWSQAMKAMSADLVLKFMQDQIKLTVEWLANQARILAAHIAAEAGMTTATTAGAAARSAAAIASGETSILATLANALKAIFAGGGQTAAEVSAAVAPAAGPAAPAIGLAAGTALIAGATGIAQMAVGGYVMREGLIYAHQGEVVPAAKVNMPYQGDGMGGGSERAFARIADSHAEAMAGFTARHERATNSLLSELFTIRQAMKRARFA